MPLYKYEHNAPAADCRDPFEVLQKLDDAPLERCPECGEACHRVIAAFAPIRSTKTTLSPQNLEKHGFTQYKKAGGGYYEKTCGKGPKVIKRR